MTLINPRAVAGANNPPTLTEEIEDRHADLLADIGALVSTELPMVVTSDESAKQVSAVGRDATTLLQKLKAAHKAEKEPFLRAGKEVDAWLNAVSATLTTFLDDCKALVGAWQDKKAAEERAEREREARRLAAEAEAAAQAALKTMRHTDMETAAGLAEAASMAEAATVAPRAELARVTSAGKTVADRRSRWVYEVVNLAEVPREYLAVDDAKVKAAIAGANGKRDIPGLRIYEMHSTSFR